MPKPSKADPFEKIATSVPQGVTAAKVVGKGVHYEAQRKELGQRRDYRACVEPIRIWRNPKPWALAQLVKQYQGKKFGRWLVIGYAEWQPEKKDGANYVVKCSCGRYEMRKLRSIRNAAETNDCCWECKTLEHHKRRYRELGGKTVETYFAKQLSDKAGGG